VKDWLMRIDGTSRMLPRQPLKVGHEVRHADLAVSQVRTVYQGARPGLTARRPAS
jgi:hypothetical protein